MKFLLNQFSALLGVCDGRFRATVLAAALFFYGVFLYFAWMDYPNPYVDEAFFVPPAQAFSQSYGFFSSNLDPHRALHWMPFGYAVLCGLFMKLSGVAGIWGARLFSTVVFGLALLLLAVIGKKLNKLQLLLLYAPFLTMPMLTLARLGRMEALFLLLVLTSLWLMLSMRLIAALAVALLSGLVHPNGAYVLLGCSALVLAQVRTLGWRSAFALARRDMPVLVLALVCVLTYAIYELSAYQDFVMDMSYQFKRKARGLNLFSPLNMFSFAVIVAGGAWALFSYTWERAVFVAFGVGLILARVAGQEIWYSPGYIVGLTMMLVAVLPEPMASTSTWRPGWMAVLVAASLGAVFTFSTFVLGWHGGRIYAVKRDAGVPDDAKQAEAIVRQLLVRKNGSERPSSVSCIPFYECLLLVNPAAQAGLHVRLRNPVTAPPIGEDCVFVSRATPAQSTGDEIHLNPGRIVSFEIRPCGLTWPTP